MAYTRVYRSLPPNIVLFHMFVEIIQKKRIKSRIVTRKMIEVEVNIKFLNNEERNMLKLFTANIFDIFENLLL